MIFGKGRRERELDEEIQAHFRLAEQDGHSAESARRDFGNVTLIKETARELWGWASIERLVEDMRIALRSLSRTPGTTATMILTLALGIGASTAIFSIVDGVLLRPLPYKDPGRLVAVWNRDVHERGPSKLFTPYRDFEAFQKNSRSFESIAATTWGGGFKILNRAGEATSVLAAPTSVNFFSLLGVAPAIGRTFVHEDLNRACTVVLAHKFWQSVLGGPADIAGRVLTLDNQPCTVAGVMPAAFAFYPDATSMWLLLTPDNPIVRQPDRGIGTFARLKPGVSIATAQRELQRLHIQVYEHDWRGARTEPMVYPLQQEFVWLASRNLRLTLLVLFAAVNLVLLIACVNVASLLLGRFVVRGKEFAIRTALGSGRVRLLRLLLTESLVLAAAGGVIGTLLASAALRYFRYANPVELPPGSTIAVDFPVLAFAGILALFTTLLAGFIPAWRASASDLHQALKAAGRTSSADAGRNRVTESLVVAEVTLSLLLMAGAGLMIGSVARFGSAPLGFSPEGLMTIGLSLPPSAHADEMRKLRFYDQAAQAVASIPGVESVALTASLPMRGIQGMNALVIDGRPTRNSGSKVPDVGLSSVSPGYFPVAGIQLKRGRNFNAYDRAESQPVAIINAALASRFFPGEDPLGKRVRVADAKEPDNPWLTIVGVVADEKRSTLYDEMAWVDTPTLYWPLSQHGFWDSVNLIFRAKKGQSQVAGEIQRRIQALDPGFPVGKVDSMQHILEEYLAYPRFRAALLASFSALALILAVVGLYGVLAQLVTQRRREIGIRMALGAARSDVVRMVARRGMRLAAIGIVLGLISVWGLTRLLTALLYGVSATDPATLAFATLALLAAAAVATCLPARRATRVDPMIALRYE
ncbi:MAG TPA: ABC transporter permease [Bryobacteraceae bacterium]|nr:ABC transporter permease [Bryobacteraceae bacterium]